ncbi:DUF4893 domain-containing protein [Sphingomonas antarctica]|uniref:DUF4893 domain-containing protein n=1 Tax=Sphingomonas antarctica TaxID=2040274 RepID=UPI0039EABC85
MRSAPLIVCAVLALGGCAHRTMTRATVAVGEPIVSDEPSDDWRHVARSSDIARLTTLPDRFAAAAPRSGAGQAALKTNTTARWPSPTPGVYRCRVHRLPAVGSARTFPPFFCYVQSDGALLTFAKGTGSDRPAGRLWADGNDRRVFLGGAARVAGADAPGYGADPATDRIGLVDRIGDFRWRLIIDAPRPGTLFDVVEFWPDSGSLATDAPR